MKLLVAIGVVALAYASPASGVMPTVQTTPDGGLYLVGPEQWEGIVESVNGCTNITIPRYAGATNRSQADQVWRSENLRNFFSTGTTVLRSGQERLTVANDRDITIGEMTVVTLPSGGREVQVQYELPVLAQQNHTWVFRRPDNSIVAAAGQPFYRVSFELKGTIHIPIPLALNTSGGTMDVETRPEPTYYYEFCPDAQDETTKRVVIKPLAPPAPVQALRGIILTDPLPIFDQRSVSTSISIKAPLGSRFAYGLLATATLGAPPIASTRERLSSSVTKPLAKRHIFADDAVVGIGGASATSHEFLAVHLGTSTWRLTPTTGAAITVTVQVVAPKNLGATENKWDIRIADIAHKTGILPQLVKGQMAQESPNGKEFDPLAYRYEPCGADLNYISSNLEPKAGGPKIGNEPHVLYRAPNPRGTRLHDDDLSPRNRYWLGTYTDKNRRKLTGADVDITARQIWDGNNISSVKNGIPKGQRWDKRCKASTLAAITEAGSTILDFVAQTPTAASYGLFQMMYDTAVYEWTGALENGERVQAPRYMFDTDENLAIEGGTITIGNLYMARHFKKTTPKQETLSTYAAFEAWALAAYHLYNSQHPTYPPGVIAHSYEFLPVSASGMF
jgi:hypothetical protein